MEVGFSLVPRSPTDTSNSQVGSGYEITDGKIRNGLSIRSGHKEVVVITKVVVCRGSTVLCNYDDTKSNDSRC